MTTTDKINKFELTPEYYISRILKGGWQLSSGHGRQVDAKLSIANMFAFVQAGITTFDCADIYSGVEELIGKFRNEYEKKFGTQKLSKLKIHTKLVPDLAELPHISKKYVESIIDRSLLRLRMEKLDLVQLHWWDFDIPGYVKTAEILSELKSKGKIEHIGVTNFDALHLEKIIRSGVNILSNQVQYSLFDNRPEHLMTALATQNGIRFLCYGVLAGGFISEKYLGKSEPSESFENRSLVKYKLIIDECGGWDYFQSLLKTIQKIAAKHCTSIANVACRFILDKPNVAGIIIGARDSSHIVDLQKIQNLEFDDKDKTEIETFLKNNAKPLVGDIYSYERIKRGKHASIMRYNLNTK